ncbi:hypothetical protein Agub_g699, partial [Astrephomene gubernaculifera]
QGAVHALQRESGDRLWTFELPAGQQMQAWDTLDEQAGIVVVRSSGTPPEDSRLYGIHLASGALLASQSLQPSYGPAPGSSNPSLPYEIHEGVVYMDSCSGQHCCLTAVDLATAAAAPQPPATPAAAASPPGPSPDGSREDGGDDGTTDHSLRIRTQLRRRALLAAAAAATGNGSSGSDGGDIPVDGGGSSTTDRSFQYCFDVAQACRARRARSVGLGVVYVLLAAQLVVVAVGFGSVAAWRLCCRGAYAPYTRLNQLPVLEVGQHDVASEEADEEEEGEGEERGGGGSGRRREVVVDE